MNKYEIIFTLDNKEKIIVQAEDFLKNLHCCSRATIIFSMDHVYFALSNDTILDDMEILIEKLSKALANKLQLHESIKKDIGYLSNEDIHEIPGLFYKESNGRASWI